MHSKIVHNYNIGIETIDSFASLIDISFPAFQLLFSLNISKKGNLIALAIKGKEKGQLLLMRFMKEQ